MFTWQQILLCGILYWLAEANLPFVTLWTLQKPLVCGWAAGMILGAPVESAVCGAVLSVILLGFSSAGSSMPIDLALTGITGAALTAAGWSPYAAVLPALVAGAAGRHIWKLRMQVNVLFARRVRAVLEAGRTTEILLPAILFPALFALVVCLPASAAAVRICDLLRIPGLQSGHLPAPPVGRLLQAVAPGTLAVGAGEAASAVSFLEGILAAAAGLLPAGGIALALTAAFHGRGREGRRDKRSHTQLQPEDGPDPADPDGMDPDVGDPDEPDIPAYPDLTGPDTSETGYANTRTSGMPGGKKKATALLPRTSLLVSALLWLLFIHICYNNEWMMGQVMAVTFLPLVRHLDPGDRERQRAVLLRQSRYFNTHCECGACIPGLMASMEEDLAAGADTIVTGDAAEQEILMVRTSLMGVCGAMGDTLFQKHLIPALLLAACLLTAVRPLQSAGPILYTIAMTILSFLIGLTSYFDGYRTTPMNLLKAMEKNAFRKAEAGIRIFLCLLSVPAAVLFVRFPIPGMIPGADIPGSFFVVSADGPAGRLPGAAAALALTAACVLCIKKFHWRGRELFLLLMLTGAAVYGIGRM
ncbi:MAG: PTS system mannose/fructose/sorbose family transporter subunit IID [Lachnospiraceae bacterium]|nr:PTS system mannose/fructose/sorbose family transporter subunit IID [Lachnospiraceae bacterium]